MALAQYQLSIGLTSDGTLTGYGTGTYGTGTYGTPRTGSTFGGTARIWSLDNWGEDLLASPNGEGLYWWQRQAGPDSRALLRSTAPPNIEHMLVGPDDRHVLALGTNVLDASASTVNGQQDRMFVRWSQGDNFDVWVETESNDAGAKRLDTGSRLVTACKTRTSILIFSDEGLYTVSLAGGQDVYQITPLGGSFKIISPGACVDVNGVVFFMGQKSFFYYDGTIEGIRGTVAERCAPGDAQRCSGFRSRRPRARKPTRALRGGSPLQRGVRLPGTGYSFSFRCHAPAVSTRERPSLSSLTLVNVSLPSSSFHL